jgi:L-alanine-DL-glutamate epimerase-like enolase superfamily enzyme
MNITSVDVALCSLPLDRPFRLGGAETAARDYVVCRIATDQGLEGFGIGYRSGTPLVDLLSAVAPKLVGRNPMMRRELLQTLEDMSVQGRATYVRAVSLIDLALWDLAAKAAELPLYQLLGGLRTRVPAIPVAGFSYQQRTPEDLEAELQRLCESGHEIIKIMIRGGDPRANAQHVIRMAASCAGRARLMVDAQWSWRHLQDAVAICRQFDELDLYCIEDPFLPQQWRLAAELRTRIRTPVAIGEDVTDIYGFLDLVPAVDVLRVDATASGGITTALAVLELAHAHGRRVVPHVFPYIHLHLACAHPTIAGVEYIPAETSTDPVRRLLRSFPTVQAGHLEVSDRPGNGADLDWQAVTSLAVVHKTFS